MSTLASVVRWCVCDNKGNVVAQVAYTEKALAQEVLALKNKVIDPLKGGEHFMVGRKIPLNELKCSLVSYRSDERRIQGFSEKPTGEKIRWIKKFLDVYVTSLTVSGHMITEQYIAHYYRGDLRIKIGPLSSHAEGAAAYFEQRWGAVSASELMNYINFLMN